jgi:hypothetical protein
MKNGILILSYFFLSIGLFIIISCDKDENNPGSSTETVTITGTLNLPADAAGRPWAVLIDNDFDGDNGFTCMSTDNCAAGTAIAYQAANVPVGTHFIYAAVFVVSNGEQGPQPGDYLGIYGGTYPNNIPGNANASVSSDNTVFNIDMAVMQ